MSSTMPASILRLPGRSRRASSKTVSPSLGGRADVVALTLPSDSLTPGDLRTIERAVSQLGTEWRCETERDGRGRRWAIISPNVPERHGYAGYLVCRNEGKLVLMDACLTRRWSTLGIFEHAKGLVEAVTTLIRVTRSVYF
jgi:hypothetical protein